MVSYLEMLKILHIQSHATEVMKYGPKLIAIDKFVKVRFHLLISFSPNLHILFLCNASSAIQKRKLAHLLFVTEKNAVKLIQDAVFVKFQLNPSTFGAKVARMVATMIIY
jgi:hypothetical protein